MYLPVFVKCNFVYLQLEFRQKMFYNTVAIAYNFGMYRS